MTGGSSGEPRHPTDSAPPAAAQKIIAAADALFREHGPAAVSLRLIARVAGVNYGLIHHYFGNKRGILTALFQRSSVLGARSIEGVVDAHEAIRLLAEPDPERASYARMTAWSILSDPNAEDLFAESPAIAALADLIEDARRGGQSRLPDDNPMAGDSSLTAAVIILMSFGWGVFRPFIVAAAKLDPEQADRLMAECMHALVMDRGGDAGE